MSITKTWWDDDGFHSREIDPAAVYLAVIPPSPSMTPELTALIERALAHKMTPAERFEQRVSFVYGQMSGALTKDDVRAKLRDHLGVPDGATMRPASDAGS